jgi:CheY-like chemotaxis protein
MRGNTICRVLFVEDEPLVAMMIEDMLIDLGVEVVGPASRVDQALALAREADMEAAVLDINVGGQSTYEVADLLRQRGVPVIFATGYGSSALPERFRGTPTLHKPFERSRFEEVMQAALAESPCEISAA